MSFNILTFDGGGLKGVLSVSILERIQKDFPDIIRNTNMIGGTSIGSFTALAIAYGLDITKIKDFYSKENVKYIFDKSYSEMLRPKYDNKHLREVLLSIFPERLKLKDLGKLVVIPTFYMGDESSNWKPIFYNNIPNSETEDARVVDVAMRSSAAPIFLPTYQNFMDGGIVQTDPSLACIIYSMEKELGKHRKYVKLLSLGTGYTHNCIKEDTTTWGAVDWIIKKDPDIPIISITLESNSKTSQIFSEKLLQGNYHRINPRMSKGVSMDDYNNIDYLIKVANDYDLKETYNWLHDNWGVNNQFGGDYVDNKR